MAFQAINFCARLLCVYLVTDGGAPEHDKGAGNAHDPPRSRVLAARVEAFAVHLTEG